MRAIPLMVATLLWASAAVAADPVYKWVDEQGKAHYSSQPPRQGAVKSERVAVPPPLSPEDVQRAEQQTEKLRQRAAELERERKAREADAARRAAESATAAPVSGGVVPLPVPAGEPPIPPGEYRPGELLPGGQVPVEPLPPAVPIGR